MPAERRLCPRVGRYGTLVPAQPQTVSWRARAIDTTVQDFGRVPVDGGAVVLLGDLPVPALLRLRASTHCGPSVVRYLVGSWFFPTTCLPGIWEKDIWFLRLRFRNRWSFPSTFLVALFTWCTQNMTRGCIWLPAWYHLPCRPVISILERRHFYCHAQTIE